MPIEAEQHQKQAIRDLFTRIARAYDRANRIMSLGQDQRWRRAALAQLALPSGGRLLDVATGTGDLALLAQAHPSRPRVIATDLTPAMLDRARVKAQAQARTEGGVFPLVVSDGLALAFGDDAFDSVMSGFMMRNVPDVAQAFREQRRVVRPGGRVVCLEMTWPQRFPLRWLFHIYFFGLAPLLGLLISGDREAYCYLPRSVREFRSPAALAETMVQAGLREVRWSLMMLGTVAIHVGVKPAAAEEPVPYEAEANRRRA